MRPEPTPCPICSNPITIEVCVRIHLTWRDAVKLRLAGPESRANLLDEVRLRLTEAALGRQHPEND